MPATARNRIAAIQATFQMPLGSTFDVGSGSAEPAGRLLGDGLLEGLGDGSGLATGSAPPCLGAGFGLDASGGLGDGLSVGLGDG